MDRPALLHIIVRGDSSTFISRSSSRHKSSLHVHAGIYCVPIRRVVLRCSPVFRRYGDGGDASPQRQVSVNNDRPPRSIRGRGKRKQGRKNAYYPGPRAIARALSYIITMCNISYASSWKKQCSARLKVYICFYPVRRR